MAKKVIGEDGKTYTMKEKKPFYKRVWFWVIAIIVVAIVGGALGGDDEQPKNGGEKVSSSKPAENNSSESSVKEDDVAEPADEFYKIGDTVAVGDVEYTLTGVEFSEERNQFDETNPDNVVKISYTVKNNGDSDLAVGMDVEVYGSDDKKTETYPNDNTMGSVAPGKQMDVVAHFGLNAPGEIEIHFAPLVSFKQAAVFKATI